MKCMCYLSRLLSTIAGAVMPPNSPWDAEPIVLPQVVLQLRLRYGNGKLKVGSSSLHQLMHLKIYPLPAFTDSR